jgi:hypothetical protein
MLAARLTIAASFLIFPAVFVASAQSDSPSPAATPAPSTVAYNSYRPCTANPVLAPDPKKKVKKSKYPLPHEAAPACVEIKGQGIGIQEFLQAYMRDQNWRTGENLAAEDGWSFVRYLNDDQLASFANTRNVLGAVVFTSGKAAISVRTTDLNDGFVRVQVTAQFLGEGKSTDKTFTEPGNQWPLSTKGALEQELLTVLEARYRHAV